MNKRFTSLIMLIAMAILASAQETKAYIKPVSGITMATVTNSDSKYQVGYVGGAEFDVVVNKSASLTLGALFTMQGCEDINNSEVDLALNYLNFPILVNYYPIKGLAFKVGLQPGIKLISKFKKDGESIKIKDINSLDVAIPVGISYEISNFILDARYNFHVRRISDGVKLHNSVFQLTFGYKIEL